MFEVAIFLEQRREREHVDVMSEEQTGKATHHIR
jgi:hypothetical protein